MIGSFITRGLLLVFGYVYPAYECYKSVELNKPDIEQLRFWCQYWILVAGLTVCERIGDMFIGWVPMYGEAKLAFFVYLWFPKTKGTTYVYDSFFRPYVAKHETEIDRSLLELRIRAGDMVFLYWQKAASYSQTRIFDVLQYIASQSAPQQRPAQPPQPQDLVVPKPNEPLIRRSASVTEQDRQSSSLASKSSSSELQSDAMDETGVSEDSKTVPAAAALNKHKTAVAVALVENMKTSTSSEQQVVMIDSKSSGSNENAQAPPEDTVLEEQQRVTRARYRKARTPSN